MLGKTSLRGWAAFAAVIAATLLPSGIWWFAGPSRYAPEKIEPPLPPAMPLFRPSHDLVQLGNHHTIHVKRAPAGLVIDGNLSDWDLAGRLKNALPAPYSDAYWAEICLLYDDENLYFAASIGDPYPLRNSYAPKLTPDDGGVYLGGSVSIHLAEVGSTVPDAASEVHLQMWSAPNGPKSRAPCLRVNRQGKPSEEYSVMKTDGQIKGEAAIVMHGNLAGYTMEYKIPWELIGEAAAPERKRLCVDIHWSDMEGTAFRAMLSEVINSDEARVKPSSDKPLVYQRPKLWGTAVFHP